MADTKKDDAALSINHSPGTEDKPAPTAEITLETLTAFPVQGSAVSARLTPTDLERLRSDSSYWNGNGVAHPEVEEGGVHDAPEHQGLPSFAQSEFYTVDTISVYPPVGPGLLMCFIRFLLLVSFLFFFCYRIDCSSSTS